MKKGGVMHRAEYTAASAFYKFIENSKIGYLGSGASGTAFSATWQEPLEQSPYVGFRSTDGYIGEPIATIAFKLLIVDEEGNTEIVYKDKLDAKYFMLDKDFIKITTSRSEFHRESGIITSITDTTLTTALEPIGPINLFRDIIDNDKSKEILDILHDKCVDAKDKKLFTAAIILLNKFSHLSIGIHAMECMGSSGGYDTMSSIVGRGIPRNFEEMRLKQQNISIALFELLSMAKHGWSHGDFHQNNILFTQRLEPNTYFKTDMEWAATSRAFVIDFGRSVSFVDADSHFRNRFPGRRHIPFQTQFNMAFEEFERQPTKANLRDCVEVLFSAGCIWPDGTWDEMLYDFHGYNWVVVVDETIPQYVKNLFIARRAAIEQNLKDIQELKAASSISEDSIQEAVASIFSSEESHITIEHLRQVFSRSVSRGGSRSNSRSVSRSSNSKKEPSYISDITKHMIANWKRKDIGNPCMTLFVLSVGNPSRMDAFITMFRGLTYLDTIKFPRNVKGLLVSKGKTRKTISKNSITRKNITRKSIKIQ